MNFKDRLLDWKTQPAGEMRALIQSYLALTTDSEEQPVIERLVEAYLAQSIGLSELIQQLGPALTSTSEQTRLRPVKLLSSFIAHQDVNGSLTPNQVTLLVQFFTDKLSDHPVVLIEAIPALQALSRSNHFKYHETLLCIRALFENTSDNQLNQPSRLQVLILIDLLLAHHRQELQQVGNEFISGYCNLLEGEKDPRNLLVAFRLSKVILTEFDIASKVQELFDITFCYFPITFRPPPGNPEAYGGITADELSEGLIDCLAATPRFAILSLPLLLDKLQATSIGPKTQVLKTIIKAFPVYGQQAMAEYASLYWESFANEIFQPGEPNPDVLNLLSESFKTFIRTLFPPREKSFLSSTPIEVWNQILDSTLHELSQPEKSKAVPAAVIITWIATSGADPDQVVSVAIERTVEVLLGAWTANSGGSRRSSVLIHLCTIFTALSTLASQSLLTPGAQYGETRKVLRDESKNGLLAILIAECLEKQGQVVSGAIAALTKMVQVQGLLTSQEIVNVVDTAIKVWASSASHSDIHTRDVALTALAILATLTPPPPTLCAVTLPYLFTTLPDPNPFPGTASTTIPDPRIYIPTLEALATLSSLEQSLFETFVPRILNRLEFACSAISRSAAGSNATNAYSFYAHHLLLTLYIVLSRRKNVDDPEAVLARLFAVFITEDELLGGAPVNEERGEKEVLIGAPDEVEVVVVRERVDIRNDEKLVSSAGRIMNFLVGQMTSSQQQGFVRRLYDCFELGKAEAILCGHEAFKPRGMGFLRAFRPMSSDAPESDKNLLVFYAESLISIKPDVVVPGEVLSTTHSFPFKYYRHALEMGASSKLLAFKAGLRVLCSTVNRRCEDFPTFFDEELEAFWKEEIELGPLSQQQPRMLAIEIWTWIVKGLVMRSDKRGYVLLDRLCELWNEDSRSARDVAQLIGVLVNEADDAKNFGLVKVLWKQRVCGYLVNKLVKGYHQRDDGDKTVYLIGLASLLAHASPHLIIPELPKIMQLLLDSLQLEEAKVKVNVLKTLYDLVVVSQEEAKKTFEAYISTLIKALLQNTTGSSEPVRLGALSILDALPTCFAPESSAILWSERKKVLSGLGGQGALDDKRKAVRKAAVDCRTKWFGLKAL